MKKTYSAPLMEIERFDVEDIITESGSDKAYNTIYSAGDTNAFEVIIESAW